jgi:CRISPR-associated protein Cas2
MPMTIVVTRDVPDRYRGFFGVGHAEVAPGVYIAPELSKGVRERIWTLLSDWWSTLPGGSIIVAWKDSAATSGLGMNALGIPPVDLVDLDGVMVVRRRRSLGESQS